MPYCGAMEDIATGIADKYRAPFRSLERGHPPSLCGGGSAKPGTRRRKHRSPDFQNLSLERSRAARCRRKDRPDGSGPLEEGARSWSKKTTRFCRTSMPLIPVSRGDPMSPLRWTGKKTTRLAKELKWKRHTVSQKTVYALEQMGYRQTSIGAQDPGKRHPCRPEPPVRVIRPDDQRLPADGRSRYIRRKNSSETSRTRVGNGKRKVVPKKFVCMTSSIRISARSLPTESTTNTG